MSIITEEIRRELFSLQDEGYKNFQSKLIPTVNPDTVIGVRTPRLRKLAKEFAGRGGIDAFLSELPHTYYEENNVHGFIIETIKDYDSCVRELDRFLPYVDNWATCDSIRPKIFAKNKDRLIGDITRWINATDTYTIRFGIEMLMTFFLDDDFKPEYAEMVAAIRSEEYYVNMIISWYFATALTKQYDAILPYVAENRLDTWTHNKSIQKALESYRISKEKKDYLRTLKRRDSR
ncbi:MAG: DNA alkylation repair protein [Lachnospiraceae bacterium]